MKKLYIVRHGQTDYNYRGVVQGSGIDASLNDTGRYQAQLFYDMYKDFPFDKLYISELRRTKESVQHFIDAGLNYERLRGLDEINWGEKEGQSISPEENKYYYEMVAKWQNGETHLPVEGGESPEDVAARQRDAMKHIMAQQDEENVLICMHGRAMRVLLCQLLNYPISSMDLFKHQNLGLYQLTYTGSMFRLDKANDSAHLQKADLAL